MVTTRLACNWRALGLTCAIVPVAALAAVLLGVPVAAQATRPAPVIEPGHVVIEGCVARADPDDVRPRSLIVWAPGELIFDDAVAMSGLPSATAEGDPVPFAYWLTDGEDLARFVGEHVEVTGTLVDREEATVLVRELGPATEISFDVGGRDQTVMVPTAWLGPTIDDPQVDAAGYGLVVREIAVDAIEPAGPCAPAT